MNMYSKMSVVIFICNPTSQNISYLGFTDPNNSSDADCWIPNSQGILFGCVSQYYSNIWRLSLTPYGLWVYGDQIYHQFWWVLAFWGTWNIPPLRQIYIYIYCCIQGNNISIEPVLNIRKVEVESHCHGWYWEGGVYVGILSGLWARVLLRVCVVCEIWW